nr:integrase, catalytic region, zinc finger, CCHC-type, peptidase aspartic, catalytic [Tanacetum cinerariifolium]
KQLKKANTTLAQELKECKAILAETSKFVGESISVRDSYLVALQNKQIEFEKNKAFNDRTVDYDKLERKLNETLGKLAQKDIEIKEGLKTKAYEILVVKEKHDELIKESLLTKSHYEGLVKQKTKVITDLKLREEHDIDKILSMEKQLKFLNEIVYKRSQSIQTIHMMAPKVPTYNGRPTFANPRYLKQAQSEIPYLYAFPYDQSTHANRLILDGEETLALERENQFCALTAQDMEILIQTCLMPLAIKTQIDSFLFIHELKQEMHADLKYVESLKKEIDELESDKAEFSNMYDMILQECVSKDVMCSYLLSLSDLDALDELQCLYLHKVKECDCLAQKLSKQTESVCKEVHNELLQRFAKMVHLILFIVDSGCTKHVMGNLKLLCNFVEKFLGTVRFGNDQFAPILGYVDLVQGNVTINRVYYVEGLNHNLFSVGQFCDADLEVAFRKSTCFVRDLQGNDLLTGNRGYDLYTISLQESTSSTPLCLMAKASPTQACNCNGMLYSKLIHNNPDSWKNTISHLTRDGENLDKMKEKGDQCILVGYSSQSKGYRVYNKRTMMIVESIHIHFDEIKEVSETSVANKTSSLVPQRQKASDYDNPDPISERQDVYSSADADVPSQQELDMLFGPLYDEIFNAGTNPSTTIPSTSTPSAYTHMHAGENNNDQAEEREHIPDDEFTNPFYAPTQEVVESSTHNIGNSNVLTFNQPQVSEYRWTKDHPLEQVHGNPS